MRIIGQDKQSDIPYDNTALSIHDTKENTYRIDAFCGYCYTVVGVYKTLDDAKAVLWKIAESNRENKPYFEIPQPDEEIAYPYREEK